MMGSKIELKSTPGEGSHFFFTLTLPPSVKATEEQSDTDWSSVTHLASGQTVYALVVDDVANNRDILINLLTHIGVQVEEAQDGKQALEMVRQNMPNIVFTDIRMPNMDGAELLQRIVEEHSAKATKIVATTASVFEHERQEYLKLGFDAFINKPIQFEEIYACLSELLDVTYQFKDTELDTIEPEIGWQHIKLSPELHASLKLAVEEHSITQMRQHIQTLEQMGDDVRPLVQHLKELARQFDMEGIKLALDTIDV